MFLFYCKDDYYIKLNEISNETMKCTHYFPKDYKWIFLLGMILSAFILNPVDFAVKVLYDIETTRLLERSVWYLQN